MNRLLTTCAFAALAATSAPLPSSAAVQLIREDRVWEYDFTDTWYYVSAELQTFRMRFGGPEELGGKTYHRLMVESCVDIEGNEVNLPCTTPGVLMRQEGGKVYIVPHEPSPADDSDQASVSDVDELLLYDFDCAEGESYEAATMWDSYNMSTPLVVHSASRTVIDGEECRALTLRVADQKYQSGYEWLVVEGIGIVSNGRMDFFMEEDTRTGSANKITWNLRRVYDASGAVVFDSGIKTDPEQSSDMATDPSAVYEYATASLDYRSRSLFRRRFDGTQTVDGRDYLRFATVWRKTWSQRPTADGRGWEEYDVTETEVTDEAPSLMRVDKGIVYLLLPGEAVCGGVTLPAGSEVKVAEMNMPMFIHGRRSECMLFDSWSRSDALSPVTLEYSLSGGPATYPPDDGDDKYLGYSMALQDAATGEAVVYMMQYYGPLANGTLDHPMTYDAQEKDGVRVWLNNVYGPDGEKLYRAADGYQPTPAEALRLGVETAVSDADGSSVRYLDLLGRTVTHPAPGQMLIRLQGAKAEKIVF